MKLYGHYISLTTLQVMALLAEKGSSAELVLVDVFAGEQKRAPHRARHPFGYIPVLEDDGFTSLRDARHPALSRLAGCRDVRIFHPTCTNALAWISGCASNRTTCCRPQRK